MSSEFSSIAFQINNTKAVSGAIKTFFALVETNERMRKLYGGAVLDVFSYDLKSKPRETLKKICTFLGVFCDDNYFKTVGHVLSANLPSRTRDLVEWKTEDKAWITTEMKRFPFLESFSFEFD